MQAKEHEKYKLLYTHTGYNEEEKKHSKRHLPQRLLENCRGSII